MSDAGDYAAELELGEREQALAAHRARVPETPFEIEGRRVCLDCFEPIARQRLKVYPQAVRCVDCQREYEVRARGHN